MVKVAFLYAYDRMVASTDPGWLQSAFNMLMGLKLLFGPTDELPKDCGVGIQALPGGWGAGRQSLHPEDDGRGEELRGVAEAAGNMPGNQEVSDKGVTGDAPPNPALCG